MYCIEFLDGDGFQWAGWDEYANTRRRNKWVIEMLLKKLKAEKPYLKFRIREVK